jgi:hypothetical protein
VAGARRAEVPGVLLADQEAEAGARHLQALRLLEVHPAVFPQPAVRRRAARLQAESCLADVLPVRRAAGRYAATEHQPAEYQLGAPQPAELRQAALHPEPACLRERPEGDRYARRALWWARPRVAWSCFAGPVSA